MDPLEEYIVNMDLLEDLRKSINRSSIGELAIAWARSLPTDEEKSKAIRIFQAFWSHGIVITNVPEGAPLLVHEFWREPLLDTLDKIRRRDQWRGEDLQERIVYYMKFREWLKDFGAKK